MPKIIKWTQTRDKELYNFLTQDKNIKSNAAIYAEVEGMNVTAVMGRYYTIVRNMKKAKENQLTQKSMNITTESGARNGKGWTAEESRNLVSYLAQGKSTAEMAELLHRTTNAINGRLWRLERKKALGGSNVTTLKPIQDYLKENNLVKADSIQPPTPQASPKPSTFSVMQGQTIRIPIVSISVVGQELLIQL